MGNIILRHRLENINEKIQVFSFNNVKTIAKIPKERIYDGDTCHVIFRYYNRIIRVRVRMAGYDCPEIKSKNKKEQKLAILAKEYFTDLLKNSNYYVQIKLGKNDKYGRPLATFYSVSKYGTVNNTSINAIMIKSGHAVEYSGGAKQSFQ